MKQVSEMDRKFFEDYERGVNASDHELLIAKYNHLFVFASPHGVQVIKKDDFVKVLSKRHGFLRTVEFTDTHISSIRAKLTAGPIQKRKDRFEAAGPEP